MVAPFIWLSGFLISFYILPFASVLQTAGAVTATVLAIAAGCIFSKTEYKFTPLTTLVLSLWGLAGISVFASEMQFVSLIYFFFFSAFPLTFLLFGIANHQTVIKAIRAILLALGIASIIQFFAMPDMLKFGGTHWPFADNNTLGAVLAVGSLLFYGEALRGEKGQKLNVLASLILCAAIITTEGRAVILAFAAVFIILSILAKPESKKPVVLFIIGTVLLLGMMKQSDLSIWHWFGDGQKTIESFATQDTDKPNALTGSRLMIWESATKIIAQHPVIGTGIGTFFLYYPEFRHPWDDSAGYMAHNDMVQFATEMGLLAPLLAIAIVAFVTVVTFKNLKTRSSIETRLDLLVPFAVFILITGHSLVNFNFYILPTLMISGLMLAIWNKEVATKTITLGNNKKWSEVGAVFGTFIILSPLWSFAISEYKVGQALDQLAHDNAAGFSENLTMADNLGFGLNGRVYLQAALFAEATNDNHRAEILLGRAQKVSPRIGQIYIEQSRIWADTDKPKALQAAETALRLDPSSIPARMQLADILESMDNKGKAYDVLKEGMTGRMRSPDPRAFYQRIATLSLTHGDFDTNKLALERLDELR